MHLILKTIKFLIINIIVIVVFCCLNASSVYAGNNSLARGTLIATPNGNIPIEELHSGDRVIGYNFETHQEEINHVKDIQQSSSLGYYLINNHSKFSGNNYIFIKSYRNPIVKKIYQLNKNDQVIGRNIENNPVQQINQVIQPSKLYKSQLIKLLIYFKK